MKNSESYYVISLSSHNPREISFVQTKTKDNQNISRTKENDEFSCSRIMPQSSGSLLFGLRSLYFEFGLRDFPTDEIGSLYFVFFLQISKVFGSQISESKTKLSHLL